MDGNGSAGERKSVASRRGGKISATWDVNYIRRLVVWRKRGILLMMSRLPSHSCDPVTS